MEIFPLQLYTFAIAKRLNEGCEKLLVNKNGTTPFQYNTRQEQQPNTKKKQHAQNSMRWKTVQYIRKTGVVLSSYTTSQL